MTVNQQITWSQNIPEYSGGKNQHGSLSQVSERKLHLEIQSHLLRDSCNFRKAVMVCVCLCVLFLYLLLEWRCHYRDSGPDQLAYFSQWQQLEVFGFSAFPITLTMNKLHFQVASWMRWGTYLCFWGACWGSHWEPRVLSFTFGEDIPEYIRNAG